MMPTIVQKPKILDISEVQSGTPRAICCWLEMVGVQDALHCTRRYTAMKYGGEAGFIRCQTPNSVGQRTPYRETRIHLTLTRFRLHPE